MSKGKYLKGHASRPLPFGSLERTEFTEDIAKRLRFLSGMVERTIPDNTAPAAPERVLSSVFIESPVYGTRSSTLVTVDYGGNVEFTERVFNSHPEPEQVNHFSFKIE